MPLLEKVKLDETNIQKFADNTVEAITENEKTLAKALADQKTRNDELEAQFKEYKEKIDSLILANKSRGSWKEQNTPEAKNYGLGKIVRDMVFAHRGVKTGDQNLINRSHSALCKAGCTPQTEKTGREGWTGTEKMIPVGKAGLSSSPLTGDDSVGSYGGSYTIPVIYNPELQRIAMDSSVMMGKVTHIPVTAITTYFPKTTDELIFTKVTNQNTDKTEDTLTFSQLTLTTEIYAAWIPIVEEFFEDTLIAIGNLVKTMFGEAWGKKFDDLCLEDSTYGILPNANINSVTLGDNSFDSVKVSDCKDLVKELDSQTKRNGAEYYMHVTNWDHLEDEKDDDGNYILRKPAEKAAPRLHGYPVNYVDAMVDNASSAADTAFIGFGNPRYIIAGDRIGFEFKVYDQTQSAMESGQIFLRVRVRQAILAAHPEAWSKLKTSA